MKLEDQVTSLELSKRLRELDVKQESLFVWRQWIPRKGSTYLAADLEWRISFYKTCADYEYISAFTASEQGEMLPKGGWHQESTSGGTRVWFVDPHIPQKDKYYTWHENEVEARAGMLIHLIESGVHKP